MVSYSKPYKGTICHYVFTFSEGTAILSNVLLGEWAGLSSTEQRRTDISWIYTGVVLGTFLLVFVRSSVVLIAALRAAERLHSRMLKGLLWAQVRFFDTNPSGRIMNRFSASIGEMDEWLSMYCLEFTRNLAAVISGVSVVSAVNPWLLLASVPFMASITWLVFYFLRSAREIKRLQAISCSPLYAQVSESSEGVVVIRACSMEEALMESIFRSVFCFNRLPILVFFLS